MRKYLVIWCLYFEEGVFDEEDGGELNGESVVEAESYYQAGKIANEEALVELECEYGGGSNLCVDSFEVGSCRLYKEEKKQINQKGKTV